MKLPITDEFLWDIFNVLNKTGHVLDCISKPHTMKNLLPNFENPVFAKYRNDKNKAKFSKLVYYAKRNNYIKVKNLKNKQAIILTKEGLSKVLKASFIIEGREKRKDGKWTMLIFDVPEKYRASRHLLRSILHNLGYKMFQQSVWITPYDVSEKTEQLLQTYSLDEYVKIFLIEEL